MTEARTGAFQKPRPWTEVATLLVDVATGRKPADLVVRNGRWVNVHSGEIIPAIRRGIAATESGTPALLEFITAKEITFSLL